MVSIVPTVRPPTGSVPSAAGRRARYLPSSDQSSQRSHAQPINVANHSSALGLSPRPGIGNTTGARNLAATLQQLLKITNFDGSAPLLEPNAAASRSSPDRNAAFLGDATRKLLEHAAIDGFTNADCSPPNLAATASRTLFRSMQSLPHLNSLAELVDSQGAMPPRDIAKGLILALRELPPAGSAGTLDEYERCAIALELVRDGASYREAKRVLNLVSSPALSQLDGQILLELGMPRILDGTPCQAVKDHFGIYPSPAAADFDAHVFREVGMPQVRGGAKFSSVMKDLGICGSPQMQEVATALLREIGLPRMQEHGARCDDVVSDLGIVQGPGVFAFQAEVLRDMGLPLVRSGTPANAVPQLLGVPLGPAVAEFYEMAGREGTQQI